VAAALQDESSGQFFFSVDLSDKLFLGEGSMRLRILATVVIGACLALASRNVLAQPFPPGPTTDSTQSLGQFVLVLNPSISGAFVGTPGYTASTNTFMSPLLYDPNTQINRSMPLVLGNSVTASAPVGAPISGMVFSNSGDTGLRFSGNMGPNAGLMYPVPSGSGATSPFTDSVFTQIKSFDLTGPPGFAVTTGTAAMDPNLPASVGQVTSTSGHSSGGTSSVDFPARSFFDVFVDIDIPLPPTLGGGSAGLTNGTVYSGSTAISPPGMPLIIGNSGITTFPPVVIYTHGNSTAVPLFLETTNNGGLTPDIGAPIGLLILAGHGAGYSPTGGTATDENTGMPANQSTFQQTLMQDYNSGDTLPVPPQYASWLTPYTPDTVAPEPSTLALLATVGASAVVFRLRRRWRRSM
jgi:hypothetical protein